MSKEPESIPGTIVWVDLTVPNAEDVRDFYSNVVGWESKPIPMGKYDDFAMSPPGGGDATAGICHAQGVNDDLPAQWLLYITVSDLEKSMAACKTSGGEIVAGPKNYGDRARYCVIKDPAGAVMALFEEKA